MTPATMTGTFRSATTPVSSAATLKTYRSPAHAQPPRLATAAAPTRAMATLRNLAVGALHLAGRHDTTEATRWASRNLDRPFTILGLTPRSETAVDGCAAWA